jgi:hypothetical protein
LDEANAPLPDIELTTNNKLDQGYKVTVTVFKYKNKIGKIVVKAVPYSVT